MIKWLKQLFCRHTWITREINGNNFWFREKYCTMCEKTRPCGIPKFPNPPPPPPPKSAPLYKVGQGGISQIDFIEPDTLQNF